MILAVGLPLNTNNQAINFADWSGATLVAHVLGHFFQLGSTCIIIVYGQHLLTFKSSSSSDPHPPSCVDVVEWIPYFHKFHKHHCKYYYLTVVGEAEGRTSRPFWIIEVYCASHNRS